MEYKIPDNFLIETDLTDEQIKIFVEQINRFNELSKYYSVKSNPLMDEDGNLIFKEGTLIHGISAYDEDKLDNISKTGILTGQAVGVSEDGETYYCADFHRVDRDITVEEYCTNFKINDGRCPFGGARADNSRSVAFVVAPNEVCSELLSYDCYRVDTKESDITRSFVNLNGLPRKGSETDKVSSILYGVPYNFINGIVVGGKILDDENKIKFLMEKFPNCYIMTAFGELIYDPSKDDYLNYEVVNLRREKYALTRDRRKLAREINDLENQNNMLRENYDLLMNEMIKKCNSQDIVSVLGSIWNNGVDLEYVEKMKDRRGR